MNYFELFNLPVSFSIDKTALSSRYQTLQRLTHPDRFASGSEGEKAIAVTKNAQVNDAYHVLKHDISRATHLLELNGLVLNHEQKTLQDSSFLMQQMELREQLDELREHSEPSQLWQALSQEVESNLSHYMGCLTEQLATRQWELSAETIRKLKFLDKLVGELDVLADQLDIF